jgi:hypothetical protein
MFAIILLYTCSDTVYLHERRPIRENLLNVNVYLLSKVMHGNNQTRGGVLYVLF